MKLRIPSFRFAALSVIVSAAAFAEGEIAHWHVGPFFEKDADEFLAVRPFWADAEESAAMRVRACEVVWPVGAYRRHGDASRWRALLAYGDARDDGPDNSWSANLFPIWFCGRARGHDDSYWALFPIWGEHPHFIFMDDWRFALWPVWHSYTTAGVRSNSILWPLVSWKDEPREAIGAWPFYGQTHLRESDHWYVLWPIATWATHFDDRDTPGAGSSWMIWPFAGGVRRERESQFLFLPPLFSYAETPHGKRWRLPWPLVDVERKSTRNRVSVWPLVERAESFAFGGEARRSEPYEDTWRFLWVLIENSELRTDATLEKRFAFFPFFTSERRWRTSKDGKQEQVGSFWRVWPFWSRESERRRTANGERGTLTRSRVLDLNLIRHHGPIERNWSPFWTLWSSTDRPDGTTHETWLFDFIFHTFKTDGE